MSNVSFGNVGATAGGSSSSNANQDAAVYFQPSVNYVPSPPVVSVYPAGQGLSTLNSAYPGSAAYQASTYGSSSSTVSSIVSDLTSSSVLPFLIGAACLAAYFLFAKKR